MARPDAKPEKRPKTAAELRADIDRGVTGDKIPGSDPAAAPLGTDAEAAGTPPTRRELDLETRSRTVLPHRETRPTRHLPWMAGGCALVVLLVILAFALGT